MTQCDAYVSNTSWDDTSENWACPCCRRTKEMVLRPNRKGQIVGALHFHHDHMMDYPNALLREKYGQMWMRILEKSKPGTDHFRSGLRRFVERFLCQVVCQDCNVAEGSAKQKIQADRYFSFAIPEIRQFIQSTPNTAHGIDEAIARTIYASQKDEMSMRKAFVELWVSRIISGDFWTAGYSFAWECE